MIFSPSLLCSITVVAMLYLGKKSREVHSFYQVLLLFFNHFVMVRSSCRCRANMVVLHDASGLVFVLSTRGWWDGATVYLHLLIVITHIAQAGRYALLHWQQQILLMFTPHIFFLEIQFVLHKLLSCFESLWKAVTEQMIRFEAGSSEILKEKTRDHIDFLLWT